MNYYKGYFAIRHVIAFTLMVAALLQIKIGNPVTGFEVFLIGMLFITWFDLGLRPYPLDKKLFDKENLIEKEDLDELSKTAREKIAEQSDHIQLLQDRVALLENLMDTKRDKGDPH